MYLGGVTCNVLNNNFDDAHRNLLVDVPRTSFQKTMLRWSRHRQNQYGDILLTFLPATIHGGQINEI